MKKRMLAIMLSVTMMSVACSSGGGQTSNTSGGSSSGTSSGTASGSSTTSSSGSVETPTGPVKLTIGVPQDGNILDRDTNYFTKRLSEMANVQMEFVYFPNDATEARQKFSLMISGSSELPEITIGGGMINGADITTYGQDGIILRLNDYIESPEKMPIFNSVATPEDKEFILKCIKDIDGNIYSLPMYQPEIGNEYSIRAWINTTWLDKLKLDMPKTTDDFYNVLKAFKEKDPNGNGKADEIPLVGSKNGWNNNPIPFILNAFLYIRNSGLNANNVYLDDNGEIVPSFMLDEYKEGLMYINKLVSEDLLSPLTFTQDFNQFKTIIEDDSAQLLGCFAGGSMSAYKADSIRSADIDVLPPLTGPKGKCYASYMPTGAVQQFFITKYCKDIDAAIRLGDAFYDHEMSAISRNGEPEVDWTTNIGDAKSPYESSGIKTGYIEKKIIWGTQQNSHWNNVNNPRYMNSMDPWSVQGKGLPSDTPPKSPTIMTPKALPYYLDKHPKGVILGGISTAEEQAELADLGAVINTYVDESTIRFVTGDMSFSEWDTYLKTLKEMNVDRYLELTKIAIDRFNK